MMSRPTRRVIFCAVCAIGLACNSGEPAEVVQQQPDPPDRAPLSTADAGADAVAEPEHDGSEVEDDASEGTAETGGDEVELPEPGEPGPKPPEDYGQFKFPSEPLGEDQLTRHGAAGYEVVAVYAEPSQDSTRLGFLRIGTRMRVGEKIKTEDCHKGWHAIEGGGYACASRGLMVDSKPPFMSYEPKPPRLAEAYPYDWAYVREWNTPMWWQVPNGEQLAATKAKRAEQEFAREVAEAIARGEPPPQPKPVTPKPAPKPEAPADGGEDGGEDGGGEGGIASLPPPDGEQPAGDGGSEPAGEDGGDEPAPPTPTPAPPPDPPEPEEEKEPVHIPFSPTPWLEKGYYLSLGESIREEGKSYWRTARGGVVEKAKAHPVEPKDFQGAELYDGVTFPVGFVMVNDGTKLLTLGSDDQLHGTGKRLEKRDFLDLGEEVEISGRAYFTVLPYPPPESDAGEGGETGGGEVQDPAPAQESLFVRADVMRQPQLQPMPKGLDPWDRWIDVDITKQMLVAYDGPRPAFVTLVSTGKKGTDEEPFETPTGRFRIRSKQVTSNMDGATATDGNYAIQDVPWVMYFQGSYALHGAFWHRSFGYTRSHGCVNLGPSDARWLFYWTTPFVPETWHGVATSDDNKGTTIVIRRSEES